MFSSHIRLNHGLRRCSASRCQCNNELYFDRNLALWYVYAVHIDAYCSLMCTIETVPSGMYAAVYTGTVYIYCKNKNIVLMLTAKIWIDSVKEVPYKLVYCCIHLKFIHYPCHQIGL